MPADCDQETHRQIHTDHATAVTIGRILVFCVRCGLTARYEPGERCRAVRRLPRGETAAAAAGVVQNLRPTDHTGGQPPPSPTYTFLPAFLPSFPVLLLPVPLAHWSTAAAPPFYPGVEGGSLPAARAARPPAVARAPPCTPQIMPNSHRSEPRTIDVNTFE